MHVYKVLHGCLVAFVEVDARTLVALAVGGVQLLNNGNLGACPYCGGCGSDTGVACTHNDQVVVVGLGNVGLGNGIGSGEEARESRGTLDGLAGLGGRRGEGRGGRCAEGGDAAKLNEIPT